MAAQATHFLAQPAEMPGCKSGILESVTLMTPHIKRLSHCLITLSFSLLLSSLLVACQIQLGGSTTAAPTPTPTPIPVPTLSVSKLVTYTGAGYTIGYPQGWTVTQGGGGLVTFADPQGIAYLSVKATPNPGGVVTADNQVSIGLQLFKSQAKNYQMLNVAPTTTVGGDSWSQGSATGDIVPKGQTAAVTANIVVIADNHPANLPTTMGFEIAYLTGQQVFDIANNGAFQPMLQSFKFTS
jgi:hypothetical protein